MHNTMKNTITVCSLLTLLSVCQWGWAESPHFNLIGSFAEGEGQWSTTNSTKTLNKSYHDETSKYYIDVDVVKDKTYYFAFNNNLNNDGTPQRYAPLTENTETQNKVLDLSALLNYEPVEAAKGAHHQSGGASYNEEHGGQDVSNHSWKITANYTGKLRICVDQSGEGQHYFPYVWLERPAYYLIGSVINGDNTWSAENRNRPLRDKIGESTYYRYFYMPQNAYFAFTYREMRYAPLSNPVEFSTLPQTLSGERKDDYKNNSWKYTGSGCSARVKVDVSTSDVAPVITVEESWPDTVYPVGSGCWVGWSTDGRKAMTETASNSGIYKDTLKLKGTNTELKFLCVKGEYSTMFGKKADTDDISDCGTYQVQMENGGPDSKWRVNLSENTYFVVLDAPQSQLRIHPYLPSANLSPNPDKTALTLGESVHFAPAMSGYNGEVTYTYLVNNEPVELEADQWQPSQAGTYQVKVQINAEEQCVTSAPSTITVSGKNVTVRLHATEEAKAEFDSTFYLYYWGENTGAQMAEFSVESDGWREATVHIDENLKFLVKNVNSTTEWGDGVKQTTTVDNAGKGYTANVVCAAILSRGEQKEHEYFKYKLYELSECTYSTNNFTIHAYVDDALKTDDQTYEKDDTQIPNRWDVVSFYTYGNAHMQYNDFWINDISSGEDGWYSHTYRNVDSVNLVIAGSTASWTGNPHRQAQDIKKITTDKYFFVTNSPNNTQNDRRVAIELPHKITPITLTFRFTDVARQTWEGLDVYLRYWMYYQEPGDGNAYDHAFYKQLVADGDGIYSCTILPIAPVKLTIQSGGSEYHTEGHWTNDLVEGYTTNKDFIIKDYNDGGHVIEEYTEEQMKVHMTPDGFASACWDKDWTTDQAGVYIGTYIPEEGLELKPVSDPIVPANQGVFLYNPEMGNQYITLLKTDNTPTADYSGNALKGTTSLTNRDTEKTTYVLGYSTDQSKAMLFRYTAAQIPSYKAYLEIPVIASAPKMRMFIRNKTTDVNTTKADRMVVKKMESGRIVIVVNGLKYNIVGQKIE